MQLTHVHEQHTALPIIHALTPTHILPVVCDPVMGDDSRLYVPEELVPIFREELCPLADVLTPNHYEAEYEYPCLFPPPPPPRARLSLLHGIRSPPRFR